MAKKQPVTQANSSTNIKRMVLTAVLIGLGTALSLVKLWKMPLGGSVTLLSMLPVALISIEYGLGWGLSGAFIFSLIQLFMDLGEMMAWGLSPLAVAGTILFDYVLAFTAIGLAGAFRKKGVPGICAGVFLALFLRFLFHLLSGTLIFDIWMPEGWGSPLLYSICYNGTYMLPELVFTLVGAIALFKAPSFNRLVYANLE